jgi:hypothetical protein
MAEIGSLLEVTPQAGLFVNGLLMTIEDFKEIRDTRGRIWDQIQLIVSIDQGFPQVIQACSIAMSDPEGAVKRWAAPGYELTPSEVVAFTILKSCELI